MAIRLCFMSTPNEVTIYQEKEIEFKYYSGFAITQKQKCIRSLHESIRKSDSDLKILEISTKSEERIGVELSAFNLKFFDQETNKEYPIENVFQSSKVFENGGPYRDLLNVHPKEAKRDERLKTSGKLICFNYNKVVWDLEPKSMFYDWLYINSLIRKPRLVDSITKFNAFTDIEFNQNKSINCQARAAAIFVSAVKLNILDDILDSKTEFMKLYQNKGDNKQLTFFN